MWDEIEYNYSYTRCGKIIDTEILNFNIEDISTHNFDDEILSYCVDRIIRSSIREDDFELDIHPGYYGEECYGLVLDQSIENSVYNKLLKLKDLPDTDKIKYVLELEYEFLLPSLIETTNTEITNINMNDILFNDQYRKKVPVIEEMYNLNYPLARGVFLRVGDKFRLIDGYHRLVKAKLLNLQEIKGIVLF